MSNKKLIFDFSKAWKDLSNVEKAEFTKKVKQIEVDSAFRLSDLERLNFDEVYNNISPLDPEEEWGSTNPENGLPADYTWIDYEIQFYREELREKMIL
jgi:hypothetical protein